ncbi:MAG: type II toxin-antitoxin system HicB family antitoxin [Oscillospiraceae bacterium]|nr:type II toxin-antitoxin system HicB family antitoxin [Oscillospiraceae bacterium]
MKKDKYSYIAAISFDDDGISINFPDLDGCFTCAETEDEISQMAKEVLGLHLWSMEQDNETIPEPSNIKNIKLEENEAAMLIEVFMPPVRDRINNRVVKKTLTIPQWLNVEAERNGVNFSQILQNGLKEYLHIESET